MLFQKKINGLFLIKEKDIDLESTLQGTVEKNIDKIFPGLEFVSHEFPIHNYRIDTLAFDSENKSFVIIEYKKEQNSSVVDQGAAYLSVMLNNPADFILEYNEKKNANLKKQDVDWSQSKIIFIADSFGKYQKDAAGFKDLPIELWEAKVYEGDLVSFERIETQAPRTSIKTIRKTSERISQISREVKQYTLGEYFGDWKETRELFEKLKSEIMQIDKNTIEKIAKYYIAYSSPATKRSFVELVGQKRGLQVYLRPKTNELKTTVFELNDCSKVGHWTNGNTRFSVTKKEQIPAAIELIKQTYRILEKR
jgi:predicted transport protein